MHSTEVIRLSSNLRKEAIPDIYTPLVEIEDLLFLIFWIDGT